MEYMPSKQGHLRAPASLPFEGQVTEETTMEWSTLILRLVIVLTKSVPRFYFIPQGYKEGLF